MTMLPRIFGEKLFDDWMNDDFPFTGAFPAMGQMFGKHEKNLMKTDVKENADGFVVDIDLPGYKKEDIKAELNDGYLTVSANRSYEHDDDKDKDHYIRRERFTGSCSRTFYVGDGVKQEDIKARFENGILTLMVPKKDEKKLPQSSQIAIEG